MDIASLQIFLTVVDEGGFSRAAWRMRRSQPAISQTVRKLELEVGEPLFDRSLKGGTLTEAGRVFLEHAKRLVNAAEEAKSSVRELRELRRGRVQIGANEGSVYGLLSIIQRFTDQYPDILVDVRRV